MQPALQSLALRSVMDRAAQTLTRVSMLASSSSVTTREPVFPGTASALTADMGTDSLSRCSCRVTVPGPGTTL